MKANLVKYLRCIDCGGDIMLQINESKDDEILEGHIVCNACKTHYPIKNGLPIFASENYASTFGLQWNKFKKTQLDSFNGTDISKERFKSITGWDLSGLRGKTVLDIGCGSGRFSEICLRAGAEVIACDLSMAVNACYENLSELYPGGGFNVVQASMYALPFKPESFNYVFCIGVIQHTPDPSKSIRCISSMVKKNGAIALWIYERNWKSYIGTPGFKYLLRPLTKRMGMKKNDIFAAFLTVLFSPLILSMRYLGVIGRMVLRLMPVASSYLVSLPLTNKQLLEWVYLDTMDMYSPAHDHPMKFDDVKNILESLNFKIKRTSPPGISVSGIKGGLE